MNPFSFRLFENKNKIYFIFIMKMRKIVFLVHENGRFNSQNIYFFDMFDSVVFFNIFCSKKIAVLVSRERQITILDTK